MPTIRTTLEPDREIEVGDAEALDLARLGLVHVPAPAESKPAKVKPEESK